MIRVLTITFLASMLAGCAGGYDKSAGIHDCKRPAARPVSQVNLGNNSTFESSFAGIPGEGVPGGTSERIPHDINAYKCVHSQDKGTEPRTTDLQKIGAAERSVLSL